MPKKPKSKTSRDMLYQVAALPYRRQGNGDLQILVMTSRETRRFIIPKGWPMKGKSAARAAAIEAKQEAGVGGEIGKKPFGRYRYFKRKPDGFFLVEVEVFPLEVSREKPSWQEQSEREQCWLTADEAALLVDEPELVTLIREFAASFQPATESLEPAG